MRIDAKVRRLLSRRIRDRIAPAIRAGLVKAPIAIFITATFWLSPEAVAQVQKNAARIEAQEQTISAKAPTSQDDLNKKAPTPIKGIDGQILDQLTSLIKTMGENSGNLKKVATTAPAKDQYFATQSAMLEDETNTEANGKDLKDRMASASSTAASKNYVENNPVWQKLRGGFDFKLDLSGVKSFFSKNEKAAESKRRQSGQVRYGLILKEIALEKNEKFQSAAINTSEADMLRMAGQADIRWTIGPLNSADEASPMQVDPYSEDPVEGYVSDGEYDNIWTRGELPSASLKGHASPQEGFSPGQGFLSGKQFPKMTISLKQEQDLYEMIINTDEKMKKETVEHQLIIPLVGALSVGRRYNEQMDVVRTSLNNILVSKKAPIVSVHYMHQEDLYVAEASVVKDKETLSLRVTDKPFNEGPTKYKEYQYQVEYKRNL